MSWSPRIAYQHENIGIGPAHNNKNVNTRLFKRKSLLSILNIVIHIIGMLLMMFDRMAYIIFFVPSIPKYY